MRIVFVAPRFPYPLDKGDRLTVFNLLRYFSQRHQVSLVCFLEPGQNVGWKSKVESFCELVEIVTLHRWRAYANCLVGSLGHLPLQMQYYSDPGMRETVKEVVRKVQPDLLYAHTIRMGQYIDSYRAIPRILAMQISMTLNYRRLMQCASGVLSRLLYSIEYRKLESFEDEFARRFDRVLLISEHDLNAVQQDEPLDNVFFSPHGVDFDYFSPSEDVQKESNTLVFTGNMNYAPNIDAARYFCEEIHPLVRAQVPGVRLYIAGADPVPEVETLGSRSSVEVTGRVPDLRIYMNRAQIAIDPLRVGAGLQNKVLEGMSMGLPMVITPIANEGIQAVDGKHVLIADTPQEFAEHIVHLLRDPKERARIGTAARNFIMENWSWEKHFSDLEEMLVQLVE
jgi:sugar transferase (PEP-CTERM/EpsH1 system associated)